MNVLLLDKYAHLFTSEAGLESLLEALRDKTHPEEQCVLVYHDQIIGLVSSKEETEEKLKDKMLANMRRSTGSPMSKD